MRKVMAMMCAAGLLAGTGMAQNPNLSRSAPGVRETPAAQNDTRMKPKSPDEWVSELDAVVSLSADQKIQAKALAENRQKQMKALREEMVNGADKAAVHQKKMQLHKEHKAELAKILNQEQLAKWDAYRKAKAAERGGPQKHRTPDEQVNALDAIVGLSAEQKAKVKALAETKASKMKALRDEQKKAADEKAFKEKRKQIGSEYRTELDKILTPEQKAKLKAHREAQKKQKGAPTK